VNYASVALAALSEGVLVQLASGEIVACNPAAERILGLTLDQMAGRASLDIHRGAIHEDGSPWPSETQPAIVTLRTGEAFRDVVMGLPGPDGKHKWISVNSEPFPVGGGRLSAVVTIFSDITDRRRDAAEAGKAMAYNRSLIEASVDPFVTIGRDGRILDVNEATVRATGVPREDLVGSDFSEYFTDREKARAGYSLVFREGKVRDYELQLRHRDGSKTPVEYNATVYRDAGGEVLGIFAVARDISARKLVEAEVRRLVAQRDVAKDERDVAKDERDFAKDEREAVKGQRDAVEGQRDLARIERDAAKVERETVKGQRDLAEGQRDAAEALRDAADADRDSARTERDAADDRRDLAEGRRDVAEALRDTADADRDSARAERDAADDRRDVAEDRRDVAEDRRDIAEGRRDVAEEELRQLNQQLELRIKDRTTELMAANAALEGFSYSVSHDLRAPLRAIVGFSSIVESDHGDHLDAEGHRLLGIVRANALRMSLLIDDLLAFSRAGRGKLLRTRVNMKVLAQATFDEVVADPAARTKIDFKLGDLPDAEGDASLLRQVWVNLLSNATKYSARVEKPVIEVYGAAEGDFVVYRVRDNGAGFDMAYADKLFGVFQRLHGTTEFEGTGIGLALVQQIVVRHGGRVWGEGAVGKGATFSFSLPL
jgi:PAS domain S-box-containing protein